MRSEDAEVEARDFFISYTARDQQWAQWIAYALEDAGYSTLLQAWDFRSSGNFVLEMHRALQSCERTIAVLSPAYENSGFSQAEWAAAFKSDPTGELGKLITVRVDDYEPGGLLGPIVYIDLVGVDRTEAESRLLEEIATTVGGGRRKPSKAPGYPGSPKPVEEVFPGDLAPIWNLPIRLRSFVGREALLKDLAKILPAERVCILHGLGGVGKSRAALELAYRSDGMRVVWRVRAREEATAREDMAALGAALGLVDREMSREEAIEAALDWLSKTDDWLLILDDAKAPEEAAALMPSGAGGQVLITSQAASGWATIGAAIELPVLEPDDGDVFISSRVAGEGAEVRSLSETLGDLPLALEQASAYMEATGIGPAAYLERLEESAPELFSTGTPVDYQQTVATTWGLAMAEMNEHGGASQLLQIISFLAPDSIPRGLFDGADTRFDVPAPMSTIELDEAIAELRRFSLVSIDAEQMSVHRLVQWATRQSLSEDDLKGVAEMTGGLLIDAWPDESGNEPSDWPACGALAAHLDAYAALVLEIDSALQPLAAAAFMNVGVYLRARGDLRAATDDFHRAVALLDESEDRDEQLLLIEVLGELGLVLSLSEDHPGAVSVQERALGLVDELGFSEAHEGAAAMCLAGISFQEAGDSKRARDLYERALTIFRSESPPNTHLIGSTLGNLGNIVRRQGDLKAARAYQFEAIELLEAEHGPAHHEVGIALSALARVERDANNMKTALGLYSRGLEIFEAEFGPDSSEVARTCHDRSWVHAELGKLAEARADVERTLSIYGETIGPDDPRQLLPLLQMLTRLCIELGDRAGARKASARAASIAAGSRSIH